MSLCALMGEYVCTYVSISKKHYIPFKAHGNIIFVLKFYYSTMRFEWKRGGMNGYDFFVLCIWIAHVRMQAHWETETHIDQRVSKRPFRTIVFLNASAHLISDHTDLSDDNVPTKLKRGEPIVRLPRQSKHVRFACDALLRAHTDLSIQFDDVWIGYWPS